MGNEAQCEGRYGDQQGRGKVLLETKELIFRGDFRVVIPLAEMKSVEAKGGTLSLTHKGNKASFDVGPQAVKWAEKIKNPKGRADKLGLKAGQKVAVVGVDDASFKAELEGRVGELGLIDADAPAGTHSELREQRDWQPRGSSESDRGSRTSRSSIRSGARSECTAAPQ